MKRLAKDQIGLRKSLPPNYFFEDADAGASLPDDLTQLLICLAGPDGTPYSQGVWHVRLDIPIDYPQSPPTAAFQTRIFHPNVAEETGAVCLETLKRDWDPKLTLRDILITISCLLIQPNPDSALNQKAGALIQDDYDAFARQARMMTKIHAPTPGHLLNNARDARRRGEEPNTQESSRPSATESAEGAPSKENQPSRNIDVVKAQEKSRKRSLAESSACADNPCIDGDIDNSRRKSSRHESSNKDPPALPGSDHDNPSGMPRGENICELIQVPEKVIFRARWGAKPGTLRTKARIGIRRL